MSDQSEIRNEEIEEFLNESFMIVDQLEDGHNSKTEKDTESAPAELNDNPDLATETEVPEEDKLENDTNNEVIEEEEARTQQSEEEVAEPEPTDQQVEEIEHKENEIEHKDNEEMEEEDDTEIEEITSCETYNLDSSGASKQEEETRTEEPKGQETKDTEEEDTIDSHPYLYLVESFELTKEQKTVSNVPPKSLEETPLRMVNTRKMLLGLLQTVRGTKEIAVNLQIDYGTFSATLLLLEISTRDSDYIIDALKLKSELLLLTEIFINPKIVKIIYKAEEALTFLQQNLHLFVVNVFDVSTAGMALNKGKQCNISAILKNDYSFESPAHLQHSDFRVKPLSDELKRFCRGLSHYLIPIYHSFKNRLLQDEKLYKDVMDRCRNMCRVLYPNRNEAQLTTLEEELKKRHVCQLEILKKLYKWRDDVAKKNNKNPNSILHWKPLVNLASNMPVDEALVYATCNAQVVKTDVKLIIAMVLESKKKHKLFTKKGRMGRNQRLAAALAANANKVSNIPQGVKRQLDDKKVEVHLNKQKRTETTSNKTSNDNNRINENHKSKNQNKYRPTSPFNNNKANKRTEMVQRHAPSTFVPPRAQSSPKPLLDTPFNLSTTSINSNKPKHRTRQRPSRFNAVHESNLVFLKPTNVPSNTRFQSNPNVGAPSFQAPPMNKFQQYTSPLSNFSGAKRDDGRLNRFQQGNMPQGFNTFNQVFDAIDQKINTLERKVSVFEVTNDPNDMESNMYRRRY